MNNLAPNITYTFAEFELDPLTRVLSRRGEPVSINPKALEVLCALVQKRGEILSKDELLAEVWPGQFVEENNLTVHVAALRKVLGETKNEHRFIVTVPGKGYRFVAELNEQTSGEIILERHKVERIVIDEEIDDAPGKTRQLTDGKRLNRKLIFGFVGLVVLIAAGFTVNHFFKKPRVSINSLAVLPFTNQDDANSEYLGDGLSDNVIYSLSQSPNLRVVSRTSAFRFRGKDADAKSIGRDLNVQAIVTGRVAQRGDTLMVSAELISTTDNSVIWGETFTRKLTDIAALQTDIAKAISQKLQLKLSGAKASRPVNAEAYQLYLQGLHYLYKRTGENIQKSILHFQQAIEKDPTYAQAYGALAMARIALAGNAYLNPSEKVENVSKAKSTAQKALELDDTLAEAYTALGELKWHEWNFAGAENDYRRAIELNPNSATARQWYSEFLSGFGRYDEAISEITKARELDPFSRAVNLNFGLRYQNAGRYDEAIAVYKRLIETEPDYALSYVFLGTAYEEQEMYEEAVEPACKGQILLKFRTPEDCTRLNAALRQALKREGGKGYWRILLLDGLESFKKGDMEAYWIAAFYGWLGDNEHALEYLEKSFAAHEKEMIYMKTDLAFNSVANDPRFKNLLDRVGFPKS